MKKSLRLFCLIGALGATAWLGSADNASALVFSCEAIHSTACRNATPRPCQWADGSTSTCYCVGYWDC